MRAADIYKDSDGNTKLDKYDNTGSAYFYYAKERLSLDEYEIDYSYSPDYIMPEGMSPFEQGADKATYNGSRVFLNGAVVTNSLAGEIGYVVDAEWIAAELQGGTGSIDYKLQCYDAATHEWKDVYLSGVSTREVEGHTEYSVDGGNTWTTTNPAEHIDPQTHEVTYDGLLTIDGFSAELMEKDKMFNTVRKYDDDGNLLYYRVVQTNVHRTDNGKLGDYTPDIEMAYNADGTLNTQIIDGKNVVMLIGDNNTPVPKVRITVTETGAGGSTVSYDFEVSVIQDGTTFYYDYKLVGDVRIVMNKDWNTVPANQVRRVRQAKVRLQLMKYNYKTGNYEKYDAEHGNPGGVIYTSGEYDINTDSTLYIQNADNTYAPVTDSIPENTPVFVKNNNNEYVRVYVSDATGIFVVERTDAVDNVPNIKEKHYAVELLNVPMYDEEGRLNRYSLTEAGMIMPEGVPEPDCSPIYAAKIDQNPMLFTADNIFGDGGEEIHFHKVWMDDGEEEYKDDVRVDISARGMQLPFPHGDTVAAPANWESMDDTTFNTQVSAVENNTGTSGWLFRTTERNNALTTLWSNDSPYLDPLRADVLGYHYLYAENGTTSVPKKYYGVGTTGTVDYYADITADSTTGDPLVFMLQRRPKNSTGAFETVTDSGLVAAINYENVDRQPTYTQTSATGNNRNRITLNAPNYLVNGKYYVIVNDIYNFLNVKIKRT